MPQHQSSPPRRWTLTDVSGRIWQEEFSVVPSADLKLAGSGDWSVRKHTLRGGLSEGVDVIEIHNGRLMLSILPTRGMGIWRGTCDGLELGWRSPVELPVHPAFVNPLRRNGLGWLEGFNEWICRCGLEYNGAPSPEGPLHGRIANIPAHFVEVAIDPSGPGTISVSGVVDEANLFGPNLRLRSTIATQAGSNGFTIVDEVSNRSGVPGELELLYHINMGRPFLEPGGRCVTAVREVAPRDARAAEGIDGYDVFAPPVPGYAEQVYYYDLAADAEGFTQTLLRSGRGDKGVSLRYNTRELACFSLWKNTQSDAEGYVCGFEPTTNYPNPKPFERQQGRVVQLPPGGKHTVHLEMGVHATAAGVAGIEREIAGLTGGKTPHIHRQPRAGWSPAATGK